MASTQYVCVIYTHKCGTLKNIQHTHTCTHGNAPVYLADECTLVTATGHRPL